MCIQFYTVYVQFYMVRVQIHPNNANFPSTGQRPCWNREILCVTHVLPGRVPAVWKKLLADLKSDFLHEDLGYGKDAPQCHRPGFSCADWLCVGC